MKHLLPAIAWPLLLLSLPSATTPAQQQQTPPVDRPPLADQTPEIPTLHVESRLVSVALNVVDEHGAPVPGLNAADFDLTEDDRPQKIAFFDKESATPLQIVLAIDASESVFNDDRLEREAARTFVRTLLRPQDRLDLMAFSDNVSEVVAFTNDPKLIESGLGHLGHGDATALYDAVYLAGQRLAEAPPANGARRVVVLITDGEDTSRHGSYDAAIEEAERAGAMIYSLIIVPVDADAGRNTGGEHALIQMSKDTGGKYYYVEDKHDLAPAFAHVSDDLRTQYTVGYYAPRHSAGSFDPSGLRHIHLELRDPARRSLYTLRYRTVYYANQQR
jgi:Ca-activated chloride channel family protein